MNYVEATNATVATHEALAELRKHGITAVVREEDYALIDAETGELIAEEIDMNEYDGGDIVAFLGY